MILTVFVYSGIFISITNWCQIYFFAKALKNPKKKISVISDRWITSTIRKKTGIVLKRIIIFENSQLFGMMPGIPLHPEMILSRGLYKKLNRDELEWVILHEGAHCKLWHVVQSGLLQAIIGIAGFGIISTYQLSLWAAGLLGIVFSLIAIQCMKHLEWEADKFSISHVNHPRGVITAQKKFVSHKKNAAWFYDEKSIFRTILFWNILPSQRIKMAQKRLSGIHGSTSS